MCVSAFVLSVPVIFYLRYARGKLLDLTVHWSPPYLTLTTSVASDCVHSRPHHTTPNQMDSNGCYAVVGVLPECSHRRESSGWVWVSPKIPTCNTGSLISSGGELILPLDRGELRKTLAGKRLCGSSEGAAVHLERPVNRVPIQCGFCAAAGLQWKHYVWLRGKKPGGCEMLPSLFHSVIWGQLSGSYDFFLGGAGQRDGFINLCIHKTTCTSCPGCQFMKAYQNTNDIWHFLCLVKLVEIHFVFVFLPCIYSIKSELSVGKTFPG